MREQPSEKSGSTSRKLVPDVDGLENRFLLSRAVSFPNGASIIFPTFPRLPRTGGALLQSGTALTVGVGQHTSNTVHVSGLSGGTASVEWNGRAPHSLTGVEEILVQAASSGHDRITIELGSTTALATASVSEVPSAMAFAQDISHPVHAVRGNRTGPTAIQTGTVLKITDTSHKITELAVSNFGQTVQLEWNGGTVPSFTGVSTIIVNITNGRKDFVAVDNAVAKGP
jgi:hypothetical protein